MQTAAAILKRMQEDASKLYTEVGGMEGNDPNRRSLMIALIDVMSDLDTAIERAGRV